MKSKFLLSILVFGLIVNAFSQVATMELTYTAENNGQYVPLDSILIENLTQGGDTTLYGPDTVLVLEYIASIGDNNVFVENTFSVSQNYPNPFKGITEVNLYLREKDDIIITIRDILGRELAHYKNSLMLGNHSFVFYPCNEQYYLLTVTGKQTSKTIKMLNANGNLTNGGKCKIIYNEYEDNPIGYKSQRLRRVSPASAEKAITDFIFNLGDQLRYTGYANTVYEVNGSNEIVDVPVTNQIYEFEIIEGIRCPGIPTVTYEGQDYNTVLIGSQCWLKENLNVGTMINGSQNQTNNGIIEKYCYDNDPANCNSYGGLYQWNEMMQNIITQGVQGICPQDWHLPTDEEWKILEGTVDSQFPVGDSVWDNTGFRGVDAGLNLKSISGWNSGGNGTYEFGFYALPGGYRNTNSSFEQLGDIGYFWSSTESYTSSEWHRVLSFYSGGVARNIGYQDYGFSCRCLKD